MQHNTTQRRRLRCKTVSGCKKDLKGRVSDRVVLNSCLLDIMCLAELYTSAPVNRIQIVGRSGTAYNRLVA